MTNNLGKLRVLLTNVNGVFGSKVIIRDLVQEIEELREKNRILTRINDRLQEKHSQLVGDYEELREKLFLVKQSPSVHQVEEDMIAGIGREVDLPNGGFGVQTRCKY